MIFNNSISDLLKENLIKPCNLELKAMIEFILLHVQKKKQKMPLNHQEFLLKKLSI